MRVSSDLRAASHYARSLIEASLDPLVTISPEGKITDVNESTVRVTGVPREQLIDSDFADYFTEPEKARAGYQQTLSAGFITNYPLAIRHQDGHITDVLYNASIYRDEQGNALGVFAAARDITEHKRVEDALRESQQFVQTIIDTSPNYIWVKDRDGRFLLVNQAYANFVGLSKDEVIGRHNLEVHQHPDEVNAYLQADREVLDNGRTTTVEERSTRPNGEVTWWYTTRAPLVRSTGIINVLGIASDITHRKQAEDVIRDREARLNEAQRIAHLGSWEMHLDEFEVRWSAEMFRIFDWPYQDAPVPFDRVLDATCKEDQSRVQSTLQEIRQTRKPFDLEHRIVRPNGELRWIHARGEVSVDENDRVVGFMGTGLDITERKRMEDELRKSNQVLEQIFESIHVLVAYLDKDFNFLRVNSAYAKADGRTPDFFLGKNHFELYPSDAEPIFRQVVETGEPYTVYEKPFEYAEHPERGVTYWDWRLEPIKDEEGRTQALLYSLLNVTDKVKKREALQKLNVELENTVKAMRAASQYARSLIEASLDPLVTISTGGKITDVNDATIKAIGIPREELIGTDFADYFTEPEKAREGYRQVFEKGFVTDYPLTIRHRDGKLIDVIYNASLYRDPNGAVAGMFAAARDITERRRAEDEIRRLNAELEQRVQRRTAELAAANAGLEQSATFLENLLEAIPAPVFYKNREGIYLGGNEAFFNYLGKPRDTVIGKNVYDLSPKHLADLYKQADEKLFVRGGAQVYESRVSYADGTEHDVIFHKATFPNPDGSIGGLIGAIVDISERKQQEREREQLMSQLKRHATDLEVANNDLESFSYSVSHDLRAPLRAIDGFSQILQDEYSDRLNDEGLRLLGMVRDNTAKMAQLIDDILRFSRAGRTEMMTVDIDMEALVHEVIEDQQQTIEERDVHFEIGKLPAVCGDRPLLRQVLVNLIANAVKFTRPVPQAVIEINAHQEENEYIFSIKDNGVGFDMQHMDKLFGVFQRLHSQSEFEGTGAGLAIVKRIINRHGGRVWAEGAVGAGATFYFTLPAREREKTVTV